MTRNVTLHLDEFGQEALESYARKRQRSASSAVRTAALYYLADRDSERPSWRIPRFRRHSGSTTDELRIGVDDATWSELEEEAQRQGVSTELLAEHAILYFLADLDSGRLAARLEDTLERD